MFASAQGAAKADAMFAAQAAAAAAAAAGEGGEGGAAGHVVVGGGRGNGPGGPGGRGGGRSLQSLTAVDGVATFSMCSRVKTLCPARNFGRGMGRGCVMHYQKRRVPSGVCGVVASDDPAGGAAGLLLLEAGAALEGGTGTDSDAAGSDRRVA